MRKTVEVTLRDVLESQQGVNALIGLRGLPPKQVYQLSYNARKVKQELHTISEAGKTLAQDVYGDLYKVRDEKQRKGADKQTLKALEQCDATYRETEQQMLAEQTTLELHVISCVDVATNDRITPALLMSTWFMWSEFVDGEEFPEVDGETDSA